MTALCDGFSRRGRLEFHRSEPNLADLGRWAEKISAELSDLTGIAIDDATTFANTNRPLIEERFLNKVPRGDVVLELSSLIEAARADLAAE
jgi:hypothetical protein